MMRRLCVLAAALLLAASLPAFATVFATVHGVVHDPQHRPIANAKVTLQAADSAFTLNATTDSEGEFELPQAPIGVYRLQVGANGFATVTADHRHRLRHQPGCACRAAHRLRYGIRCGGGSGELRSIPLRRPRWSAGR